MIEADKDRLIARRTTKAGGKVVAPSEECLDKWERMLEYNMDLAMELDYYNRRNQD